jgi:hypothetical protein
VACAAGRQVEIDQQIKALREAPSADLLGADTVRGVEARGTATGRLSARPRAVTRVVSLGAGGGPGRAHEPKKSRSRPWHSVCQYKA